MTPNRERKAAERQRKIAAGLMRLEVWVRPTDAGRIRSYAAKLNKRKTSDASRSLG